MRRSEISCWTGEGLPPRLPAYSRIDAVPHPAQDVRIDQGIIDHDIAILHGVVAEERHEAGRAGAGADKPDPARFKDGKGFAIEAGKSSRCGLNRRRLKR